MKPTDVIPGVRLLFVNDGCIAECTHVGKIRGSDKITYTFKYVKSVVKPGATFTMDAEQIRRAFYWEYVRIYAGPVE